MKINPYLLNGIDTKNDIIKTKNKIDNNVKNNKTGNTKNIDKILNIKEAIRNGTYKIDIDKTAKEMAKYLLK